MFKLQIANMITSDKYQTYRPQNQIDWSFLPVLLSAVAGVSLGLTIGNYLGWL